MEKYRTALVLGCGRSGRAAERMLRSEGTSVTVLSEERETEEELRKTIAETLFDVCIVSPGFSLAHPWLRIVREADVPLLSELELGWSRHGGKTIAVTGSNGKSTAVKWICEMLQHSDKTAAIGGNYGIPACEVVLDNPDLQWLVLEVSSFQLETARNFRADIAVLLNVLPNHLDRHGCMEIYRRTKARIFGSSLSSRDACLVPVELLPQLKADLGDAERNWTTFGGAPEADYSFRDGKVFKSGGLVVDLSGTPFGSPIIGRFTGAAGVAVAELCGIGPETVVEVARGFDSLPHRLQKVGDFQGVAYINDSKATNLAATAAAVQACGKGIHLIAGGLPKETDYTFIKEILADRVRTIYVIGQASQAMYQAWNGVCPCIECGTLEKAFSTAENAAKPGETVLLSPGCASFDQFRSFEERGDCFMALYFQRVRSGGDAT